MILVTNKIVTETVNYLNENYKLEKDVLFHFIPGYETIIDTEGETAFYAFDKMTMEAFIPTMVISRPEQTEESDEPVEPIVHMPDERDYKVGMVRRLGAVHYKVNAFIQEKEVDEEEMDAFLDNLVIELVGEEAEEVVEEVVEESTEVVEESVEETTEEVIDVLETTEE